MNSDNSDYDCGCDAHIDGYDEGCTFMAENRYADAIPHFMRSLSNRLHFKTYSNLGVCYWQTGEKHLALAMMSAATLMNRGVQAPAYCCEWSFELGYMDFARAYAKVTIERDPKHRKVLAIIEKLDELELAKKQKGD